MNPPLIYVMGPSGAGKDSVLGWMREHWPSHVPVHWAQRTITRVAKAGGEDHEAVDTAEFLQLQEEGAFAMSWQANGLYYGLRHAQLLPRQQGCWVFVNGSRGHLRQALQSHPGMQVVHITADPEILRQRLTARQRETPAQIQQRIERASAFAVPAGAIQIDNNGDLALAGRALLQALLSTI